MSNIKICGGPIMSDAEIYESYVCEKPKVARTSYMPLAVIRYVYYNGKQYFFDPNDDCEGTQPNGNVWKMVYVAGCIYSDKPLTLKSIPEIGEIISDTEGTILEIIELKEPDKK